MYNVQVKFLADSIEAASAFVGNLQSGNTGNVDVMLTGASATMDDGTIVMEISYEDEAGKVTTQEKTITLFVNEVFMDDMMMGGDMMGDDMMMEEEQGPKKGLIIGIVAASVAAAAVVLIVFLKLRKKKKAAQALEQEIADLEKELDQEEDKKE